jgi:glucoamylase
MNAFGRPGVAPRWTSGSKQGVGTAYSTSSRVWFTLSHGILNEIYYATIDRPQVRDMQFLITDGESFLHEEKRDLGNKVTCIEGDTLGYETISADPGGTYRLIKEVIADPHQSCVLIKIRLEGDSDCLNRLQLYALLAPHLEVGGSGNSARRVRMSGREALVAWKGQTWLAMGCNTGFKKTSCGYVGYSDGWQDLHDNFTMDWEFERVDDGNIAVTAQINLPEEREFTIGIAFGNSLHAALTTLQQSLSIPFTHHRERFIEQWRRTCCNTEPLEEVTGDGGLLYRTSRALLLAHEDKTFAGALIASASIPWGETKGDEDLGGYHLVWTRDLVSSVIALLAAGDKITPLRALVYLACSQQVDGGFPQNFWIDGTPYWRGIQLDEVAFPIMLAWRLWKAEALQEFDPYPMVKAAAAYLIRQGPATQQERWEEASGYSPSTLAASIAALVCAADFASSRGDHREASFLLDYADFLESHVEQWTVTTQGTLVRGLARHFIRILPVDVHNPVPDEDPNAGLLALANQPPGAQWQFPAKEIVDAGFLELVRYGIRKPDDPLIEDSLQIVDAVLKADTPFGPCWRRYNHDGYGPGSDGSAYTGWGQGRAWPLLTGERAHYEFAAGRPVGQFIHTLERLAVSGMLPEQVWDDPGVCLGKPAGSAMPLMWAHAEYIKLLRSVNDGQVFDLIPIVADRYTAARGRRDLEVWKPVRQVRQVTAGQILRIQAPASFRLHWTDDDWQTTRDTQSESTGLEIEFVDIPVSFNQRVPIRFTFHWTAENRWEGRDYEVRLRAVNPGAVDAGAKSLAA